MLDQFCSDVLNGTVGSVSAVFLFSGCNLQTDKNQFASYYSLRKESYA